MGIGLFLYFYDRCALFHFNLLIFLSEYIIDLIIPTILTTVVKPERGLAQGHVFAGSEQGCMIVDKINSHS